MSQHYIWDSESSLIILGTYSAQKLIARHVLHHVHNSRRKEFLAGILLEQDGKARNPPSKTHKRVVTAHNTGLFIRKLAQFHPFSLNEDQSVFLNNKTNQSLLLN